MTINSSAFHGLALLADGTTLLNFLDVVRGVWGFALRVPNVHGNRAYLFADLQGHVRQRSHVTADRDHETIHDMTDTVRLLVDGLLHALQQLLDLGQIKL